MSQYIHIINGPNLNLLGSREPEIYGTLSFDQYFTILKSKFPQIDLKYYQSNHEGDLIDKLQAIGFSADGIIFNPAAYTHTSIALADTVKAIPTPVVEVHISNVYERETFRHHSYIQPWVCHRIIGRGIEGYEDALNYFIDKTKTSNGEF